MNEKKQDLMETMPDPIPATQEDESMELRTIPNIDDLDSQLTRIDNAFAVLDRIKSHALQRLSQHGIFDMDGKPYIQEDEIRKLDGPYGIYEKDVKGWAVKSNGTQTPLDDPDAYKGEIIAFRFQGIVGSKNLKIEAEFEGGVYIGNSAAGEKDRKFHDKEDFIWFSKKARANWAGRARKKLLGFNNITWAELEASGIKKDSCSAVSHKKSSADVSPEQKASEDKLRQEISAWLAEFLTDSESRSNQLEELTSFTGKDGKVVSGVRNPNKLSGKRLEITHSKVKKWHDELKAQWTGGDQNDNANTEN